MCGTVEEVIENLRRCVTEAAPTLSVQQMVELLEFVAVQQAGPVLSGLSEPNNLHRVQDIALFCHRQPFVVSKDGIRALADLVRHAEAFSTIDGNPFAYPLTSLEYQLWVLVEGALNTAAAIASFDGDVIACFEALQEHGPVRNDYLKRLYAQQSLQDASAWSRAKANAGRGIQFVRCRVAFHSLDLRVCISCLVALAVALSLLCVSGIAGSIETIQIAHPARDGIAESVQMMHIETPTVEARRLASLEADCGLLPSLILFNTWHKSGTHLARSIFTSLSRVCPREQITLVRDEQLECTHLCERRPLGANLSNRRGLITLDTVRSAAVVHLNSASYMHLHVEEACIAALPVARARFVHFIREPFQMVASFFLFHLSGQECEFADMRVVCASMRMAAADLRGVRRPYMTPALLGALKLSADKLLHSPLPQMVRMHRALSGMDHVLTLRLESFEHTFGNVASQLLQFLGVPVNIMLHRALKEALRPHDVSSWSSDKRLSNMHVNPGRSLGLSPRQILYALTTEASMPRQALRNMSYALGYRPDEVDALAVGTHGVKDSVLVAAQETGDKVDAAVARANAVQSWLHGANAGHCGHTVIGASYDCQTGTQGAFGLSRRAASSQMTAIATCLLMCQRCNRCNYITVNRAMRDCSWYQSCSMDHLHRNYVGFLSGPVSRMANTDSKRVQKQHVLLFMHLEKTAGTLVRNVVTLRGWHMTGYCEDAQSIIDDVRRRLVLLNEPRIFVEHHCRIDWCVGGLHSLELAHTVTR